MKPSRLINRNIILAAGRTSIRLEPEFWAAFGAMCEADGISRHDLARRIEAESPGQPFTSAVRVAVLNHHRGARA
jgi:predicted DNA-binding ribbon-helix-helix protein